MKYFINIIILKKNNIITYKVSHNLKTWKIHEK